MTRKSRRVFIFWLTLALLTATAVVLFPVCGVFFVNPPWAVRRLPERIKRLRSGMTHAQVWQTLGVRPIVMEGGGGMQDYHEYYPMPGGNDVSLSFDYTQQPERLIKGGLVRRQ